MRDRKTKIFIVFGTRPEAIKMAPVIKQFEMQKEIYETIVCVTAQHRQMLDQVLNLFNIKPQYDLNLMTNNQTLQNLTSKIILGVSEVLKQENPNLILIQGDTTTTFASALAAYYLKIPIGHIEAGLRTQDKYSPFPEEINRRLTTHLADFHFAPTEEAKNNLLNEGMCEERIFVTGNTVIDALKWVVEKHDETSADNNWNDYFMSQYNISLSNPPKTILVTGHRRESFGDGFKRICKALSELVNNNSGIQIIYPVHLNPKVHKPVYSILGNIRNVYLIPPLDYEPFVFLMNKCYLVLTDSGGIQEEAPSLGKPVLVMRNTTERPEGVKAGTCKIVGTNSDKIVREVENLLYNKVEYEIMSKAINPYGDGNSSESIISLIDENI